MLSELYKDLIERGEIADAYIVIKNELSRNIGDIGLFKSFIETSLQLAAYDITFDERKEYTLEAENALRLFSESTEINADVLELIKATKEKIHNSMTEILAQENIFYENIATKARNENDKVLTSLSELCGDLKGADKQSTFDEILANVSKLETKLNKDVFTDEQEKFYDTLTQSYSKIISEMMEKLNHDALLDYNKRAARQFREVFDTYVGNKSAYKNSESSLKNLLITKFLAFDTSKLFNETLIYYNHIYNMIFQDVGDSLKYKMTEWAMTATKLES